MTTVLDDARIQACISCNEELCSELQVGSDVKALVIESLKQIIPQSHREVASVQDESYWCACALWSSSIEISKPLELAQLLQTTGATIWLVPPVSIY